MDSVVNTDALLYVVVAKTLMAIAFLIIAAVAIKFGAHLFRRGLEVSSTEKTVSDHDVNVKRLTKDTWLPKGTLIKTKEKSDDDRFVKLEKDSWMPSGTLVLTPARDLETQLKLQIAGVVLMLSSLFWGWMSYLTSPLDVQSLNTQLAASHEHKIRNLLGNLQGEIGTLLTNIRDLKQAADSNVKTDTLQTGLNQIGNVLTNQLSALQQEMGVMKSEMMTVKTQPQQLQQNMNNLSVQLQQLATEQTAVKSGVENNQTLALQQTQQAIANLSNQIQQLATEQVVVTQQNLNALKSGVENNQSIALQQTQQSIATLANQVQTSLDQMKQLQIDQNLQATLIQQDLGSLKATVMDNSSNQELKASLEKTQEELARLQSLFQEIQSLKTMLGDLNKNQTEQLMNLRKDLESKAPSTVQAAPVEEKPNAVLKTLTASESAYIDIALAYSGNKIKPSDLKPLVTLGEALQSPQLKGKEILLQSYTDDKGSAKANQAISLKRADYIKNYLVKQYGLNASQIQTEGKGGEEPIASNETEEGRAQNRRIRVSVR